jgi:hypothetical protein
MGAIEALCKRAVLLRSGSVAMDAPAREAAWQALAGLDGPGSLQQVLQALAAVNER